METQGSTKTEATKADWSSLWQRIQHSCITDLYLLWILVSDAILLVVAYGILQLTSRATPEGDGVFQVAKKLSHGLFLILYATAVVIEIGWFLKDQHRASNQEK